jgi:hypothetical protein
MAVIENWVILAPGVERRLRFSEHRIVTKTITDPVTRGPKSVQALEFTVTMDNGVPVSKAFSIVSQRLAGEMGPYLVDQRYKRYEFTFIKDAPGTVPPRLVRAVPI